MMAVTARAAMSSETFLTRVVVAEEDREIAHGQGRGARGFGFRRDVERWHGGFRHGVSKFQALRWNRSRVRKRTPMLMNSTSRSNTSAPAQACRCQSS